MANHTAIGKNNSNKMASVLESEKTYNSFVSKCLEKDYIKAIGKTQQKNLFDLINGISVVNHNATVVTDSAHSTAKAVGVITAGLPHSPLKEQSNASQRARELPFLADTVKELCSRDYGCDDPKAYFLTLTIENADRTTLSFVHKLMRKNMKRLTNALYDGYRGKGSFKVFDEFGNMLQYLGCTVNLEITLNKKAIEEESDKNLYHIHFHVPIIFSGDVDMTPFRFTRRDIPNLKGAGNAWTMGRTAYQIFKYWCSLFPNNRFSPDAFDFKKARASADSAFNVNDLKQGKKKPKSFGFADALTEANKYATKPEVWMMLSKKKKPSDYLLKVFAELFNTLKGKDLHVPHGVVRDARSFIVFCRDAKILNAVLSGYYKGNGQGDYVPDIFTKINRFDGGHYNDGIQMTDDQINYFNSSLIEGGGFDASILDNVKFPNTKKGKRFEYLLNQLRFSSLGLDGAQDRYAHWVSALGRKAEGLRLALKHLDVDTPNYHDKQLKMLEQIRYFECKIGDVKSLMASVTAGCRNDDVIKHYDYNSRAKFLNAMYTMRAIEQADPAFDWHQPNHCGTATPEEVQLTRLFGGYVSSSYLDATITNDGKHTEAESESVWFVDPEIIDIYHQCKPFSDDELFNLVWSMTADDANDWQEISNFFETAPLSDQLGLMNQYGDARQQLMYADNKLAIWDFANGEIDELDSHSRIGLNTSLTAHQFQNKINEKCISNTDVKHGVVAPSLAV